MEAEWSQRSERSFISRRSERSGTSERSGKSQRSQISEKSQKSAESQLSEPSGRLYKTEEKFACSVNSESKTEVDMHPLREVRTPLLQISCSQIYDTNI